MLQSQRGAVLDAAAVGLVAGASQKTRDPRAHCVDAVITGGRGACHRPNDAVGVVSSLLTTLIFSNLVCVVGAANSFPSPQQHCRF